MSGCTMVSHEPDQMEQMEIGVPMPKKPASICGSFPNLTILTHDGTIYKLKVKRKWFRVVEVFWVQIPCPVDKCEDIS